MEVADLRDIQGISGDNVQLLVAVGVETLVGLSQSDPGGLLEELENANSHLGLVEQLPNLDQVVTWIEEARNRSGEEASTSVTRLDEVVELIPISVVKAFPVSKESILENKIAVGDVPVMDEFLEGRDLYVEEVKNIASEPSEINATVREISAKTPLRKISSQEDISKSISSSKKSKVEPLERNQQFDLRKTATPEINAGRKMHSRSYIRGVLHPQPIRVKFGAFLCAFTIGLLPLSLMAGCAILMFEDDHELVIWSAVVPFSSVVLGLLYLIFARPVKCRVCGQPLFAAKSCRRNPQGHRIPFLGYILPTSLQLLIFHWFRCMYCGTSIRLKE